MNFNQTTRKYIVSTITQYKQNLLFVLMFFVAFFSAYMNVFQVAPDHWHTHFQTESETLVVGRLVADKNHIKMPNKANIGFASVDDFVYGPTYVYQSYALYKENLPDISANIDIMKKMLILTA